MTSQMGAVWESQMGVAGGTPTYGTYGTDGEGGCEGGNLSERNARASRTPIPAIETPDGLAKCPRCYPKDLTA